MTAALPIIDGEGGLLVIPNAVQCEGCGITWTDQEATDTAGPKGDRRPVDPAHSASPAHITDFPLGLANDADYRIGPADRYQYELLA